jgi:uracil phosphoribosyltransferase
MRGQMDNLHISNHPLILHKVTLLRDVNTEPKKFRELVREVAILLAYEATRDLTLTSQPVTTPMGGTTGHKLEEKIGLVPILRAGLGMVEGIWEMMPYAEVWHMGFYRDERTLKPVAYYNRLPVGATVQICLVLDPMLATGGSAVAALDLLREAGARQIRIICIVAAPEGIALVERHHPDVHIFTPVVDDGLNESKYIVPGLGDFGDRLYGTF